MSLAGSQGASLWYLTGIRGDPGGGSCLQISNFLHTHAVCLLLSFLIRKQNCVEVCIKKPMFAYIRIPWLWWSKAVHSAVKNSFSLHPTWFIARIEIEMSFCIFSCTTSQVTCYRLRSSHHFSASPSASPGKIWTVCPVKFELFVSKLCITRDKSVW